jgi:hypothetical protein
MYGPAECSDSSSSTDKINQNDDNGDHQENVDEPAHRVGSDQPQEPQYDQNYSKSVKHKILLKNNDNLHKTEHFFSKSAA